MTSTEVVEQKPRDSVTVFKSQLANGEHEFRAALPAHIPVERFMRVVTTAVTGNPDLMRADRRSLFEAATKAAQDGLLPDGRDGALVVYGNKIQWMPMISGILKKVRNSGELASIDAQLVHANDKFSYRLGIDPLPVHEPDWFGERGMIVGVYAVAKLKDGSFVVEIMSKKQVDEVRNVSRAKSNGPWVSWYGEMARKTVLRRLSKRLPMSTDLDDLIRRDDALYDFDGARDDAAGDGARPKTLAGRLDALAGADPETGEIIELAAAKAVEENGASAAPEAAAGGGDPRPTDTPAAADPSPQGEQAAEASDGSSDNDQLIHASAADQSPENDAGPKDGTASEAAATDGAPNSDPAAAGPPSKDWRAEGRKAALRGMSIKAIPLDLREAGMEAQADEWKTGHAEGVEQRKAKETGK